MGFLYPKRFINPGTTSLRYFSCNRFISRSFFQSGLQVPPAPAAYPFDRRVATPQQTRALLPSGISLCPTRVCLLCHAVQTSNTLEICIWPFFFENSALDVLGGVGARMDLDDVGVLHRHFVQLGRI